MIDTLFSGLDPAADALRSPIWTDLHGWLLAWGVAMLRPLGVAMLLPVFSVGMLGAGLLRNALVLALALPVVPLVHAAPEMPAQWTAWAALILRELSLGGLLGFAAALPFWAMDMTGYVIDTLRGASMASVLNPLMGAQSSVFGIALTQMLCVLFFITPAAHVLLAALYDSYAALPVGVAWHWNDESVAWLLSLWQAMQVMCLAVALPAIVVMVLVDLSMGFINRAAQQLNVFFLAMPVKSAMALLVTVASLPFAIGVPLAGWYRLPEVFRAWQTLALPAS
ncbi:type III secretion system export apparatus subunit SctT [Pandoraea pulmonicola]|uniref:EscT/YscT/HrcT family type III secretion system export apparatus protein n=1 Tax=Pandoraea pulmonicola TaxID=93221 RepID=A0AAJ5D010_PANPU|nr:type III secretion system export apparatus subunit SctT [Pandoraea pulmonicola]AJC23313.2 EscT/YscT/HrcT family type III secretion system export apparatus protein [Pandoraea pulmonicola]SUA90169.1 type III secretion system protein SsaT [Pandoraea pulmonicola]